MLTSDVKSRTDCVIVELLTKKILIQTKLDLAVPTPYFRRCNVEYIMERRKDRGTNQRKLAPEFKVILKMAKANSEDGRFTELAFHTGAEFPLVRS